MSTWGLSDDWNNNNTNNIINKGIKNITILNSTYSYPPKHTIKVEYTNETYEIFNDITQDRYTQMKKNIVGNNYINMRF